MPKIVVLGAGIGGISAAYQLRETIGRKAEIAVISDSDYFQFVPSNPWVAIKWRRPNDVTVYLPDLMKKFGMEFSAVGAKKVVPNENAIELRDGTRVSYDYLVIATGPALAFDEIEGMGPKANTMSICHIDHATAAHQHWEEFCRNPGPMVIGAVQGASCFGPAYEFALMVNADLRRRKIRDRVLMTFVTSEPYVGHLGLGGVGDTKGLLELMLRDRDIKWVTNAKVDRFASDAVDITEVNDDGTPKRQHHLPSKYTMFIPGFRGIDAMMGDDGKGLAGLANPRGFILVDKHQRNPTFKNVFAVGVCIAIPAFEPTPVPIGVPKTGFMIELMVSAVAENIRELMDGKEPSHEPTWNAVCLADFGDSGVAFVALPQIPPRNVNWAGEGYWVHLAKIAFEKYFLRKVRKGSSEPGYERIVMNALGINRLRAAPPAAAK